jgi:hypothetical protein
MGKGSEPMRYAVNRLEGAILRGMEHALSVKIAPDLSEAEPVDSYNCEPLGSPQPSTQMDFNPQERSKDEHFHPNMAPSSPNIPQGWFTPLINEDMINLDLGQFDWLGET